MQTESSTEIINNHADPEVEPLPKEEEDFDSFMDRVLNSDLPEGDREVAIKRDLESINFLKTESDTETTMEEYNRSMDIFAAIKPKSFGHALSMVLSSLAESDLSDAEKEVIKTQINCVTMFNNMNLEDLSNLTGAKYEEE